MFDDTVRLTYAELAKARGITLAAARRMTFRHRWPKQVGNDGLTRVSVPTTAVATALASNGASTGDAAGAINADSTLSDLLARESAEAPINGSTMSDSITPNLASTMAAIMADTMAARMASTMASTTADIMRTIAMLETAMMSLREQLDVANARADQAEQRNKELQTALEAEVAEHRRLTAILVDK